MMISTEVNPVHRMPTGIAIQRQLLAVCAGALLLSLLTVSLFLLGRWFAGALPESGATAIGMLACALALVVMGTIMVVSYRFVRSRHWYGFEGGLFLGPVTEPQHASCETSDGW